MIVPLVAGIVPVQVEIPFAIVLVEDRDVDVAIGVPPLRAVMYLLPSSAPSLDYSTGLNLM